MQLLALFFSTSDEVKTQIAHLQIYVQLPFQKFFSASFPLLHVIMSFLTVKCLSTVFSLSFPQNNLWGGKWFIKYSIFFPTVFLTISKSLRKHIRTTQASMISLLETFSSPSHFQLWVFPSSMWVILSWQCEMDSSSMNLPRVPFSHRTFCYL